MPIKWKTTKIFTLLFCILGFSFVTLSKPSPGTKYKVGTATCESSKDGQKKSLPVSNPPLCRSKEEHQKMLKFKCEKTNSTIKGFAVKDICKS